jgi:hypothetical protein
MEAGAVTDAGVGVDNARAVAIAGVAVDDVGVAVDDAGVPVAAGLTVASGGVTIFFSVQVLSGLWFKKKLETVMMQT